MIDEYVHKKPGERLDDLQVAGLHILQHPERFRFGTDAVLLAHFAWLRPRDRVVDLGTGTGILPLLMSTRARDTTFTAIELDAEQADMAARSVLLNGLQDRIQVRAMDAREAPAQCGISWADVVVCNPPYGKKGATLVNRDAKLALARHEGEGLLRDLVCVAGRLLRNGGRFAMVHQAERMLEIMDLMREYKMQPKRVRIVCSKAGQPPKLILIESVKQANSGLHWQPPLMLYDEHGQYTPEARRIYRMEDEG